MQCTYSAAAEDLGSGRCDDHESRERNSSHMALCAAAPAFVPLGYSSSRSSAMQNAEQQDGNSSLSSAQTTAKGSDHSTGKQRQQHQQRHGGEQSVVDKRGNLNTAQGKTNSARAAPSGNATNSVRSRLAAGTKNNSESTTTVLPTSGAGGNNKSSTSKVGNTRKGGKKQSGKHNPFSEDLLGFHFERSADIFLESFGGDYAAGGMAAGGGAAAYRGARAYGKRSSSSSFIYSGASATKTQYLQAHFRFILSPFTSALEACLYDPDAAVPWDCVECVLSPLPLSTTWSASSSTSSASMWSSDSSSSDTAIPNTDCCSGVGSAENRELAALAASEEGISSSVGTVSCPICLDRVRIPKITKCGHIFCYVCILRHLFMSSGGKEFKNETYSKCPICKDSVYLRDLKNIRFVEDGRFHGKSGAEGGLTNASASLHRKQEMGHWIPKSGELYQFQLLQVPRGSIFPVAAEFNVNGSSSSARSSITTGEGRGGAGARTGAGAGRGTDSAKSNPSAIRLSEVVPHFSADDDDDNNNIVNKNNSARFSRLLSCSGADVLAWIAAERQALEGYRAKCYAVAEKCLLVDNASPHTAFTAGSATKRNPPQQLQHKLQVQHQPLPPQAETGLDYRNKLLRGSGGSSSIQSSSSRSTAVDVYATGSSDIGASATVGVHGGGGGSASATWLIDEEGDVEDLPIVADALEILSRKEASILGKYHAASTTATTTPATSHTFPTAQNGLNGPKSSGTANKSALICRASALISAPSSVPRVSEGPGGISNQASTLNRETRVPKADASIGAATSASAGAVAVAGEGGGEGEEAFIATKTSMGSTGVAAHTDSSSSSSSSSSTVVISEAHNDTHSPQKDIITSYGTESSVTDSMRNTGSRNKSTERAGLSSAASGPATASSTSDLAAEQVAYHFFQAPSGALVFLHPLCSKCIFDSIAYCKKDRATTATTATTTISTPAAPESERERTTTTTTATRSASTEVGAEGVYTAHMSCPPAKEVEDGCIRREGNEDGCRSTLESNEEDDRSNSFALPNTIAAAVVAAADAVGHVDESNSSSSNNISNGSKHPRSRRNKRQTKSHSSSFADDLPDFSHKLAVFPQYITGKVIDVEWYRVVGDSSKSGNLRAGIVPFLKHLPLFSEVLLVEIDLTGPLTAHFSSIIDHTMRQLDDDDSAVDGIAFAAEDDRDIAKLGERAGGGGVSILPCADSYRSVVPGSDAHDNSTVLSAPRSSVTLAHSEPPMQSEPRRPTGLEIATTAATTTASTATTTTTKRSTTTARATESAAFEAKRFSIPREVLSRFQEEVAKRAKKRRQRSAKSRAESKVDDEQRLLEQIKVRSAYEYYQSVREKELSDLADLLNGPSLLPASSSVPLLSPSGAHVGTLHNADYGAVSIAKVGGGVGAGATSVIGNPPSETSFAKITEMGGNFPQLGLNAARGPERKNKSKSTRASSNAPFAAADFPGLDNSTSLSGHSNLRARSEVITCASTEGADPSSAAGTADAAGTRAGVAPHLQPRSSWGPPQQSSSSSITASINGRGNDSKSSSSIGAGTRSMNMWSAVSGAAGEAASIAEGPSVKAGGKGGGKQKFSKVSLLSTSSGRSYR